MSTTSTGGGRGMSADLETGIDFSALGCKIVTGVLVVVVVVVVEVVDEVVEGGVFETRVGYGFFVAVSDRNK